MNETHQYKAMNDHDSWPMVAQNASCPRYPLSPSHFSENWIFAIHMAIEVEPMLPQPYPLPDVVTPVHSGQESGRRSDTCNFQAGAWRCAPSTFPSHSTGWSGHDGGKQHRGHKMEPNVEDRENKTEAAGSLTLWSHPLCPGQLALWLSNERKTSSYLVWATYFGHCRKSQTLILTNTLTCRWQPFLGSKGLLPWGIMGPILYIYPIFQENVEM